MSILNELAVDSRILDKFTGWRMYALVNIERVERYFIWTYSNQRTLKVVRICPKIEVLLFCRPTILGSPRLKDSKISVRTRTYQAACVALVAPKSDVLDIPWGIPIVSAISAQVDWRLEYATEEKRSTYGQALETISWFS